MGLSRRTGQIAFVLAVLVASGLRLYALDLKPLHHDEGVNGFFQMRLIEQGLYAYNPHNYHGPYLYYANLLPCAVLGPTPTALRLASALSGVALLLLLLPLRRALGWAGVAAGAWLLALSPTTVFFARTNIHESQFELFSLAAIAAFLVYCERRGRWFGEWPPRPWRHRTQLLTLGLSSLALLYANKETAVITYAALFGGCVLAWGLGAGGGGPRARWDRAWEVAREEWGGSPRLWGHYVSAAGIFMASLVLLLLIGISGRVLIFGPGSANAWEVWAGLIEGVRGIGAPEGTPVVSPQDGAVHRVVALALLAVGIGLAVLLVRLLQEPVIEIWKLELPAVRRSWLIAIGIAACLTAILFSSLFSSPRGLGGLTTSLFWWVQRGVAAEKTGHEHPSLLWYVELMWRFEAPLMVLGAVGWLAALARRRRFDLFVLGWGLGVCLVYSVLAYKTPWLVLNLTLPLAVAAGVGACALADLLVYLTGREWLEVVPILAALFIPLLPSPAPAQGERDLKIATHRDAVGFGSWYELAWHLNFAGYDDARYGVVYAQTVREALPAVASIKAIAATSKVDKVLITATDYWPLPVYLHGLPVEYLTDDVPSELPAVLICKPDQADGLALLTEGWYREAFHLRPGVPLVLLAKEHPPRE